MHNEITRSHNIYCYTCPFLSLGKGPPILHPCVPVAEISVWPKILCEFLNLEKLMALLICGCFIFKTDKYYSY